MSTINAEWLNQNSLRAYPFMEDMRLRPTIDGEPNGDYRVPDGLLLDLTMATSGYDSPPRVYMSKLSFAGGLATLVLSNADDGDVLASVSAVLSDDDSVPVNFSGLGRHDDIRGTAVFGPMRPYAGSFPDGVYSYDRSETLLEARCVRPTVPCVGGLFITNRVNSRESARLRGDVALVAGSNVRLDYDEADNSITINVDSNYGYNDDCGCSADDNRDVVRSINGISVQNVVIEGDGECVNVETSDGRIRISDSCSKPCCGCAELTFLNEKTNEITTAQSRLSAFAENIRASLDDFAMHVLLSDRGSVKYT